MKQIYSNEENLIFLFYKRFRDLFSDIFKLEIILNLLIANFILNACTALSEGVLRRSSKTPSGAAKRNVCLSDDDDGQMRNKNLRLRV